jgi:Protein of unknown function (DUF664)
MNAVDTLREAFSRVHDLVHDAVDGVSGEQLSARLDDEANTIAWLVWHLTRIQDDHVSDAAGVEQVWTSQGWAPRFELPFPAGATGYGHSAAEVAAVTPSGPALLCDYYDAVHQETLRFLAGLTDGDLDRVVDERWDPPVTLGVRLVSVVSDDLQHIGQASLLRGVIERR